MEDVNRNGRQDADETDFARADSDGDGLTDFQETQGPTDPLAPDTDSDDFLMVKKTPWEWTPGQGETDPTRPDTDGDGLLDGAEDLDGNGEGAPGNGSSVRRYGCRRAHRCSEDRNGDGVRQADETDPTISDTDDDGLPGGIEDLNHNGRVDPGESSHSRLIRTVTASPMALKMPTEMDDMTQVSASDGLTDGQEDADQDGRLDDDETDPTRADTDGDGLSDGFEDADRDDASTMGRPIPSWRIPMPMDCMTE